MILQVVMMMMKMLLQGCWPVLMVLMFWAAKKVMMSSYEVKKASVPCSVSQRRTLHMKVATCFNYRPWKFRRVIGPGRDVTVSKRSHVRWRVRVARAKKRRIKNNCKHALSVWCSVLHYEAAMYVAKLESTTFLHIQVAKKKIAQWWTRSVKQDDYDDVPGLSSIPSCKCWQGGRRQGLVCLPLLWMRGGTFLLLFGAQAEAMDTESGTGIMGKLPPFSGNKEDFVMWMAKFMAVATMGFYAAAVVHHTATDAWGEANCPKTQAEADALDVSVPAGKEKMGAWKRNNKAFAALTLCLPNKLFRLISGANGHAGNVMKNLANEYSPQDNMSLVEADREYASITLNEHSNPRYVEQRFAEIAALHPTAAADNSKKISIILRVAHERYHSILATQQLAKGTACTPEDLIDAMEILYRQQAGAQEQPTHGDRGHEMALVDPGNQAPRCWNCGGEGHRAAECPSANTNDRFRPPHNGQGDDNDGNNGRPVITCEECGRRGHTRDRCYCLAANASQRPPGWRPPAGYSGGTEHGNVNMDHDGYELVM
jgi:hypothetical protein